MIGLNIDSPDYAITMLMSRGKIPMHAHVEPEEGICIDFADLMRKATVSGRYRGIWGHIPNEGKRHPLVALVLKAMGLIPGSTDFYFIWDGGGGVIEFKVPARVRINGKGKLVRVPATERSPYQNYFRAWCVEKRVRYALCYEPDEAMSVLEGWGAFVAAPDNINRS